MNKHTPGPWGIERFNKEFERGLAVVGSDGEAVVAWLFTHSLNAFDTLAPTGSPAEANARLIAAAPEMLAVLQRLLPVIQRRHLAYDLQAAVTDVIAKAEEV